MATAFPFGWQVENSAGVPVSGARIYFFAPGTTTPRSAYTDSGLTVPAAHPVEADAAGWFRVYTDSSLAYDVVIKSADDSITYQSQTIPAGGTAGNQPVDATLSALAALGLESGKVILGTGVDTASNVVPGALPVSATGTSNTTARTLAIRTSDVINLEDTGLVFDDSGTNNETLLATLIEEAAAAGKTLYAPRPRTLWVENCAAFPEDDVIFKAVPGFVIKGLATGSGPVLEIDGGAFLPRLYIDGMHIDNSLCTFVSAGQSGTALSLKRMSDLDIRRFIAESTDDYRDGKGDSGITIQECRAGRIWGPVIIGQPDLGIYVTGGALTANTDDYADIEIYGPRIYRCDSAISTKRQARRVAVFGGVVEECRTGISCLEAGSGGSQIDPGRELFVSGTRFKRIGSRAIWGKGNSRIVAKIDVEDFGYDPDNVADSGGHTYAVRLEGPSHCDIEASIRQRDWSATGLQAFDIRAVTLTSGTYTPKSNRIKANILSVASGVVENTGVTANDYDLMVDTVTTPFTLASSSTSKVRVRDEDGLEWGTNWTVLKSANTSTSVTGTTSETTVFTATVPGGTLGPNGRIRVKATVSTTATANSKTFRVRFGGLAGTAYHRTAIASASFEANTFETEISNRNSVSSQVGSVRGGTGGWSTSTEWGTSSLNTASDQDIVATMQLTNTGDTLTLESIVVEILYGA